MQNFFKKPCSQQGMSSVYIIIVIIILALGITLSGGSASLFTGNMADPAPPTPTPAATDNSSSIPSGTITPTGTSSTGAWDIAVSLGSCIPGKAPYKTGSVKVTGPENGYVELAIDIPRSVLAVQEFKTPSGNFPITLSNDNGFDKSTWKISVFSGGTFSGGSWSGGTLRKIYVGLPTGCT